MPFSIINLNLVKIFIGQTRGVKELFVFLLDFMLGKKYLLDI